MKETIITSVGQFSDYLQETYTFGYLYRGVSDIDSHKLIPSAGRYLEAFIESGKTKEELLHEEQMAFGIFYRESKSHIAEQIESHWEWLAIAQHHGLPTRLLDWTWSSATALFFALESQLESDACVYVLDRDINFVSLDEVENGNPFTTGKIGIYSPNHVTPRIRAQSGVFSIHPDPTKEMQEFVLEAIRIPKEYKLSMLHGLAMLGINRKVLFPDIDGLCSWLKFGKFEFPTTAKE